MLTFQDYNVLLTFQVYNVLLTLKDYNIFFTFQDYNVRIAYIPSCHLKSKRVWHPVHTLSKIDCVTVKRSSCISGYTALSNFIVSVKPIEHLIKTWLLNAYNFNK